MSRKVCGRDFYLMSPSLSKPPQPTFYPAAPCVASVLQGELEVASAPKYSAKRRFATLRLAPPGLY